MGIPAVRCNKDCKLRCVVQKTKELDTCRTLPLAAAVIHLTNLSAAPRSRETCTEEVVFNGKDETQFRGAFRSRDDCRCVSGLRGGTAVSTPAGREPERAAGRAARCGFRQGGSFRDGLLEGLEDPHRSVGETHPERLWQGFGIRALPDARARGGAEDDSWDGHLRHQERST